MSQLSEDLLKLIIQYKGVFIAVIAFALGK